MKKRFIALFILFALIVGTASHAAVPYIQQLSDNSFEPTTDSNSFMLAAEQKKIRIQPQPEAAGLLLPSTGEENKREKRCITVCSHWGEGCMFVDQADVGMFKKCRRTCKSLAEECL